MSDDIRVCTISKYPPYMSGHSFESLYQNRALQEITGRLHYELTYDQSVYDQSSNFNDSRELIREAEAVAHVSRVKPDATANVKVFDGALIKAFTGRLLNLIAEHDINVLSTFYLDPHAYIANQAKVYAQVTSQRDIIVAHKAVGSDVLNSIANHLHDGEARFLLTQLLLGDIMLAVSQYTKDKLLEYAQDLLPEQLLLKLERDLKVLYAPFDYEYFQKVNKAEQTAFIRKYQIPKQTPIISYFGRLFPEKGVEDLLVAFPRIKKIYPKAVLVIGGSGMSEDALRQLVNERHMPDVIFTGSVSNAEKRALMQLSRVGVIPTKPILNFVETLCISALEYQAAGTPLVTTRVGGVPEAAGPHSVYVPCNDPEQIAHEVVSLLASTDRRQAMVTAGETHVKKFGYRLITETFLSYVAECRQSDHSTRARLVADARM
jgi:glycosyltransferase involved in cell wall biosynthesis